MTLHTQPEKTDAIAWCLRDQDSAAFHARAAIYCFNRRMIREALQEQDNAAYYAGLARINLLRLLGAIFAYEQDV